MRNSNLLKSPILQWWRKRKSDPESVSRTGSPPTLMSHSTTHNTSFQRDLSMQSTILVLITKFTLPVIGQKVTFCLQLELLWFCQ